MKYLLLILSLSTQAQHITNQQIDQLANHEVPTIHYSKTNNYATFTLFIKNPCTGKHTWFPFFKLTDSAGNVIPSRNGPVHAHPGTFTFNYWGKRTVKLGNRDNVLVLLDSHLECLNDRYYWCRKLADGLLEEYHENGRLRTRGRFKQGVLVGRLEQWDVNGNKYKP